MPCVCELIHSRASRALSQSTAVYDLFWSVTRARSVPPGDEHCESIPSARRFGNSPSTTSARSPSDVLVDEGDPHRRFLTLKLRRSLSFQATTRRAIAGVAALLCLWSVSASAQSGSLQIHHMDVGQGDGAVLITPGAKLCSSMSAKTRRERTALSRSLPRPTWRQAHRRPVREPLSLRSHRLHSRCSCAISARGSAYDRGGSYASAQYTKYVAAVKGHRKTAEIGDEIEFDKDLDNSGRHFRCRGER